uniref:Uncharacterized protein n=1 Tax=Oryza rufipogon TaxID=4529 RepID=A0A0E0NUX2_ORYRU
MAACPANTTSHTTGRRLALAAGLAFLLRAIRQRHRAGARGRAGAGAVAAAPTRAATAPGCLAGQGPCCAARRPLHVRRAARLAARRAGKARLRHSPRRQGMHEPLAARSASVAPLTAPTGSAGGEARSGHRAPDPPPQAEPPSPPLASPSSVFSILLAQGPVPPSRLGLAAAFPARREVEEGEGGVAARAARVSPPSRPHESNAGVTTSRLNFLP